MSQHTHCRTCGADLGANGRGFGTNECCCNRGYCVACCLADKDEAGSDFDERD